MGWSGGQHTSYRVCVCGMEMVVVDWQALNGVEWWSAYQLPRLCLWNGDGSGRLAGFELVLLQIPNPRILPESVRVRICEFCGRK